MDKRRTTEHERPPHYYGDTVRTLLFLAAAVILISIPLDISLLTFNLVVGVVLVFILTLLAGLTSPRSRVSLVMDVVVSALLFLVFEYLAIAAFVQVQAGDARTQSSTTAG